MNDFTSYKFERQESEAVGRRPSTFSEVIPAETGYYFGTAFENAKLVYQNQDKLDPEFNWKDHIEGWEIHAPYLSRAMNADMMAGMKKIITDSQQRRQVLADATLGQSFFAGAVNPINLVAIPFAAGRTALGGMLRSGVAVGSLESAFEGIRQGADPLQTYEEGAINILASTLFGGALGMVGGAFNRMRDRSYESTRQQLSEVFNALRDSDRLSALTPDQIEGEIPQNRILQDRPDEELEAEIAQREFEASELERQASDDDADLDLRERAEELRSNAAAAREELAYRHLERIREFGDDPYSILSSKFTDSVLYKMISTPMKRALQSNYPSSVKEKFVRLAHDSGVTLALNAIGRAVAPSTYQKTAVSLGELISAHDDLIRLWATETQASTASRLDLNLSDIKRKMTFSDNTFEKWLDRVNTKRIRGDRDLTDGELQAVNRINEYFRKKGELLESVGLIRSQRGLAAQIEALRAEVDDLRTKQRRHREGSRIRRLVDDRLSLVERKLNETEAAYSASSEITNAEDFYPRFWSHGQIRKRREEFAGILMNWFRENPYVIEAQGDRFVRVELSVAPDDLRARAEQAIDRILGESDPTNIDTIGVGYGRSKHFRHRTLDIPNRLVTDFIETNPMAAMKTYAARIEPRYHFQKDFGKDFRGALFDLEYDMLESGASEADLNAARRDFVGLYEQIAGTVVKNPDAISQKVAYALRELASFTYMGGAGIAAIPDFGRIVMQHEFGTVFKSVTAMLDRSNVDRTVDEARLAGAVTDIVLNSSHMRMMEDMGNNVESNRLLNSARNAFYIVNGLAPLTAMAKQLAGVADSHAIIDYSIKLSRGQLDEQSKVWLARHGIDEEFARLIARAPWQKTNDGLYVANTEAWVDSIYIPEIEGNRVNVIEANEDGTPVGLTRNGRYIPAFYRESENTIYFDRDYIEGPMFEAKAWLNPRIEGVNALPDIFETPKQWANFVMLHEINHTRFRPEDVGIFAGYIFDSPIEVRIASDGFTFERTYHSVSMIRREISQIELEVERQNEFISAFRDAGATDSELGDVLQSRDHNVEIVRELTSLLASPENRRRARSEDRYGRVRRLTREQRAEYENRINERALEDYNQSRSLNEESVLRFRAALNSGVLNQIMSATPADKPLIVKGVAYIPMRIASRFGMREDATVRGYARVENGLLGLPFQFYNFLLAATNKTVAAFAHGQVKNRMLGSAVMLGLGYLVTSSRTPDYVWNEMEFQDKLARSIDMSGLLGIYSDLFYTTLHTVSEMGGPNITNGFISPKYQMEPNVLKAMTGLAGAGPSWAVDTASAIGTFLSGDYGEGAKDFVRNLPASNLWFLRDDVNQITRGWAN